MALALVAWPNKFSFMLPPTFYSLCHAARARAFSMYLISRLIILLEWEKSCQIFHFRDIAPHTPSPRIYVSALTSLRERTIDLIFLLLLLGTEKFIDNLMNLMTKDPSFLLGAVSMFFNRFHTLLETQTTAFNYSENFSEEARKFSPD